MQMLCAVSPRRVQGMLLQELGRDYEAGQGLVTGNNVSDSSKVDGPTRSHAAYISSRPSEISGFPKVSLWFPPPRNSLERVSLPGHTTPMSAARTECFACRVTGTATFTGVGLYALWTARAAAPGSPRSKRLVAVLGAAMLVGGVLRWRTRGLHSFLHRHDSEGDAVPHE
ncbi:hypothetical protein B0H15DRAFT_870415 [Mycena belliarum]|uniref:Distal membrane-arm assembly complex protein 1-like domain-containing protein n=1 Tax=Mycena belliarum TaxID=1033014 RepID=A0AAD6XIA7_9AGAR|nr:hypothetical protein B0H15DRAFT_870415 [Mycena belliae]